MPLLLAFLGGLATVAGSIVGRVLLALGMGFVTYTGFDAAVTYLLNQIKGDLSAMPGDVLSLLGFLWVDRAIALVFSAYSAALFVKLAGSTKLTKLVTKSA